MEYKQCIHHEQLIIYFKYKIVIPVELQSRLIEWYHEQLLHPGVSRLIESMKQHSHWKTMAKDISNFTKTCKECQIFKQQRKHYGKLLPKLHDIHPWNQVWLDLIGLWNINTSNNEAPVTLLALTIIDPATSWFVITPLPNKGSETVAIAFDQQLLCKYPHPLQCIHDNGTEFVGI